jgi:hypothetical protein
MTTLPSIAAASGERPDEAAARRVRAGTSYLHR